MVGTVVVALMVVFVVVGLTDGGGDGPVQFTLTQLAVRFTTLSL